jgi:2,3-diaminopropionate biosynthesis protein SbnA
MTPGLRSPAGLADGRHSAPTGGDLLNVMRRSAVWRTIGGTPLVRLDGLGSATSTVYGKLEGLNPGGSVKDRVAKFIMHRALLAGQITETTVVIESSSGNTAIGLAQLCAVADLRLICVVDPRTSPANVSILRAYGAEVDVVDTPDERTGEYLPARLRRVAELLDEHPDSYWPNQYENEAVVAAHVEGTLPEILAALDRPPDYLYCAVSTCGTLLGCSTFLERHGWTTKLVAVDIKGSKIFGTSDSTARVLPGIGAPYSPPFAARARVWRSIIVSESDCIAGCRLAVRSAGLLTGASSGAVIAAAMRQMSEDVSSAVHVLLLPDRGERYLDTVFADSSSEPVDRVGASSEAIEV